MGVTRLRLARFGCRNRPFYRVVAIDSRKFRDAAPLEYVRVWAGSAAGGGARRARLARAVPGALRVQCRHATSTPQFI